MPLPRDRRVSPASRPGQYRALCPSAAGSVVLGTLSIATAFHWLLGALPLAGIYLGWRAVRTVRAAPAEWTGDGLARLGIGLSAAFWLIGYGWYFTADVRSVPFGYQRIGYESLQPDPNNPIELPEAAIDLQDKKVFIRGFMQPRRQHAGIKDFILGAASGDSSYGIRDPLPTEMIRVILQGDLETRFTTRQIGVGGRLQIDWTDPSGIPYAIEADCLR